MSVCDNLRMEEVLVDFERFSFCNCVNLCTNTHACVHTTSVLVYMTMFLCMHGGDLTHIRSC